MSMDGKPPADWEHSNGPATLPFIDPVVRGGGDDPKRCRHPNWVLWLGHGQHTAHPRWLEVAPLHIWQDDFKMQNRLAPNTATGIALHRTPGPCPGDRRSALVNALLVRKSCGLSHTACPCLAAVPSGGEARRRLSSARDTRGRCGQRRPTVRCCGKPMHRPEQDVCHPCPALCTIINYPRAACGSTAIEHAVIYQKRWCVWCQP